MDLFFLKEYIDQLTVVEDSEDLKISYIEKHSDFVVLSFSSTPPDNTDPHEQFITTLTDDKITGIYVVDKNSSYGNSIDWKRISDVVRNITNGRRVISIGYCMGGTLAIAATRFLNIPKVVAITPQYSIHPDVLPKESFLNRWSERISEWTMPNLDGYINNRTSYLLIGSLNYDDTFQADMFPDYQNISKITFNINDHDIPGILGEGMSQFLLDLVRGKPVKKKFLDLLVIK